jgi:hypothetical protein
VSPGPESRFRDLGDTAGGISAQVSRRGSFDWWMYAPAVAMILFFLGYLVASLLQEGEQTS